MKIITLTQGYETIVDDEDYKRVGHKAWHAAVTYRNGSVKFVYAIRGEYCAQTKKQITIRLHREILNAPEGVYVDHINHNTLDNRKENLRLCTLTQNNRNSRKSVSNTSGYKGVYWSKNHGKWRARITVNRVKKECGLYESKEDAARAYDNAAKKYYGEFSVLNF